MEMLEIKIADSPDEAPIYRAPEYKGAKLNNAVIVLNGTTDGNPTVDLIFTDENGQKYMIMTTAALIETLGSAIAGAKQRGK